MRPPKPAHWPETWRQGPAAPRLTEEQYSRAVAVLRRRYAGAAPDRDALDAAISEFVVCRRPMPARDVLRARYAAAAAAAAELAAFARGVCLGELGAEPITAAMDALGLDRGGEPQGWPPVVMFDALADLDRVVPLLARAAAELTPAAPHKAGPQASSKAGAQFVCALAHVFHGATRELPPSSAHGLFVDFVMVVLAAAGAGTWNGETIRRHVTAWKQRKRPVRCRASTQRSRRQPTKLLGDAARDAAPQSRAAITTPERLR